MLSKSQYTLNINCPFKAPAENVKCLRLHAPLYGDLFIIAIVQGHYHLVEVCPNDLSLSHVFYIPNINTIICFALGAIFSLSVR